MKKRILAALLAVAMLACSLAACSTFSTVSLEKETLYFLFRTMETVAWETPALFATSEEVAFFLDKVMPPFPMIFCQNSNLKAPHAPQEHVKESLRQYIPNHRPPEHRWRSSSP